ncbi:unnamed protein product [Protopolystoma xenopodis]|uniref:Uncharacterized protein n=1 Tax=Protopolystoma xenopodis TaxID=117903 RepID=A0A3S5CQW8_9PLAT|nr:unnamed protein product [Protopolystoma xenopodis]
MKQQHNLFSISAGTEVSRPIALHQVSSPVSNLLSSSTTALPTTVASLVTAATVANHSSPPPPKPAPPSCQVRPLYQKVQVQHPVHAYQQQLQQQLQRQQQQPPRSTD